MAHLNTGGAGHNNSGYNNHTNTGYSNYHNQYTCHTQSNHYQYLNHTNGYNQYQQSYYYNHNQDIYNCHYNHGQYVYVNGHYNFHGQNYYYYNNHSNYSNHNNYGSQGHTNTGGNSHGNSGYSNHVNRTTNLTPTMSGSVSRNNLIYYKDSITLSWNHATDNQQGISAVSGSYGASGDMGIFQDSTKKVGSNRGMYAGYWDASGNYVGGINRDTYGDLALATQFRDWLNGIPNGCYVAIGTWDEPLNNSSIIRDVLRSWGFTALGWESRDAWAGICRKGSGKLAESYSRYYEPAGNVAKTVSATATIIKPDSLGRTYIVEMATRAPSSNTYSTWSQIATGITGNSHVYNFTTSTSSYVKFRVRAYDTIEYSSYVYSEEILVVKYNAPSDMVVETSGNLITSVKSKNIVVELNKLANGLGMTDDIPTSYFAQNDNIRADRFNEVIRKTNLLRNVIKGSNLIADMNTAIVDKEFKNGLNNYTQGNCQVTLTDTGYRIYRPPNLIYPDCGNTVWGGFNISIPEGKLLNGRKYRFKFDYKGQSSNNSEYYFAHCIGWTSEGGLGFGSPEGYRAGIIPNGTNTTIWKTVYFDFTVDDSTRYSVATSTQNDVVAGTTYNCMRQMKIGYTYESTGSLGTDIYIKNIGLYEINSEEQPLVSQNNFVEASSINNIINFLRGV